MVCSPRVPVVSNGAHFSFLGLWRFALSIVCGFSYYQSAASLVSQIHAVRLTLSLDPEFP